MGLWNELDNYMTIPVCTYGATTKIAKSTEEDKVHQFLMGLDDDSFLTIWSQILALEPLTSFDKIYNMALQEKNHKLMMTNWHLKTKNVAAFVVSHIAQPSAMQGERLSRKHCGKMGDDEATCFELVRYPLRWIVRGGRGRRGWSRDGWGGGWSSTRCGRGREVVNAAWVHTELGAAAEEYYSTSTTGFSPE